MNVLWVQIFAASTTIVVSITASETVRSIVTAAIISAAIIDICIKCKRSYLLH